MELGREEVFTLDRGDKEFWEHRVPQKRKLGEPGLGSPRLIVSVRTFTYTTLRETYPVSRAERDDHRPRPRLVNLQRALLDRGQQIGSDRSGLGLARDE